MSWHSHCPHGPSSHFSPFCRRNTEWPASAVKESLCTKWFCHAQKSLGKLQGYISVSSKLNISGTVSALRPANMGLHASIPLTLTPSLPFQNRADCKEPTEKSAWPMNTWTHSLSAPPPKWCVCQLAIILSTSSSPFVFSDSKHFLLSPNFAASLVTRLSKRSGQVLESTLYLNRYLWCVFCLNPCLCTMTFLSHLESLSILHSILFPLLSSIALFSTTKDWPKHHRDEEVSPAFFKTTHRTWHLSTFTSRWRGEILHPLLTPLLWSASLGLLRRPLQLPAAAEALLAPREEVKG